MRTLLSSLLILLLSFGLIINEASAKRFGGGRSFGVQRSQSSLFNQNRASNTASLAQKPNATNKWGGMLGGMLGGLLLGGLLTSLFMGNGLASGLITWLLLGAALFFLISFVRRRMQPGYQTAQGASFSQNPIKDFTQAFTSNTSGSAGASDYPAGFNPDAFLRQAKVLFIRMQTAYDQKNIDDLKAFTAPEIFAEIQMQLNERGNAPNKTEVFNLEAELLDASKQSFSTIASVRFTGSIKENEEPTTQLDEIWHFRQFAANGEWVIGGIQQEVVQPL